VASKKLKRHLKIKTIDGGKLKVILGKSLVRWSVTIRSSLN